MLARVLLVDDESQVLDGLARNMVDSFDILRATSPEQALQLLDAEFVDVVVTDEEMPGGSGSELLAVVHQRFPGVLRIMLTGKPSVESAVVATGLGGAFRYLEKPCSAAELARVIEEGLRKRSMLAAYQIEDVSMSPTEARGRVDEIARRTGRAQGDTPDQSNPKEARGR